MKTHQSRPPKRRPVLYAVDGNWYLHRIFHTQFESPDKGYHIAKRLVAIVCKDALAVKASRIVVAFDGARLFRYKIYPEYKANRVRNAGESPYDYLGRVIEAFAECGIPTVQISKHEADDVLCSVATQYRDTYDVYVGCRDKDAHQYVTDGVFLYDSSAKPEPRVIGSKAPYLTIKDITGMSPRQFLAHQLLTGDKVDNIPMLMAVAKAKKGLIKHGSFQNWKSQDADFAEFVRENAEALRLNRKLVELVTDIDIDVPAIKWNNDRKLPMPYQALKAYNNPLSKGLF